MVYVARKHIFMHVNAVLLAAAAWLAAPTLGSPSPPCAAPAVDVCFLLSDNWQGSNCPACPPSQNLNATQAYIRSLALQLNLGASSSTACLVQAEGDSFYSPQATLLTAPVSSYSAFSDALDTYDPYIQTGCFNLTGGMTIASNQLLSIPGGRPKVLFIFSGCATNHNGLGGHGWQLLSTMTPTADDIKSQGVKIYALGFNNFAGYNGESVAQELASADAFHYATPYSFRYGATTAQLAADHFPASAFCDSLTNGLDQPIAPPPSPSFPPPPPETYSSTPGGCAVEMDVCFVLDQRSEYYGAGQTLRTLIRTLSYKLGVGVTGGSSVCIVGAKTIQAGHMTLTNPHVLTSPPMTTSMADIDAALVNWTTPASSSMSTNPDFLSIATSALNGTQAGRRKAIVWLGESAPSSDASVAGAKALGIDVFALGWWDTSSSPGNIDICAGTVPSSPASEFCTSCYNTEVFGVNPLLEGSCVADFEQVIDQKFLEGCPSSPPSAPPPPCASHANICFAVDGSGSMNIPAGGPGAVAVRSFLLALASQFTFGPDSGSVAIVRYASNALTLTSMMALEGPMVTSLEDVEYAINYYTTGGQTDMASGLMRCAAHLLEVDNDFPNVVILLGDGDQNINGGTAAALDASAAVKNANISIIALALGNNIDEEAMQAIASAPASDNFFINPDIESLSAMLPQIQAAACDVIVDSTPSPPMIHPPSPPGVPCLDNEFDVCFLLGERDASWPSVVTNPMPWSLTVRSLVESFAASLFGWSPASSLCVIEMKSTYTDSTHWGGPGWSDLFPFHSTVLSSPPMTSSLSEVTSAMNTYPHGSNGQVNLTDALLMASKELLTIQSPRRKVVVRVSSWMTSSVTASQDPQTLEILAAQNITYLEYINPHVSGQSLDHLASIFESKFCVQAPAPPQIQGMMMAITTSFTISAQIDEFLEEEQNEFKAQLAEAVGVDVSAVEIVDIQPASIIVTTKIVSPQGVQAASVQSALNVLVGDTDAATAKLGVPVTGMTVPVSELEQPSEGSGFDGMIIFYLFTGLFSVSLFAYWAKTGFKKPCQRSKQDTVSLVKPGEKELVLVPKNALASSRL